MRIKIEGRVTPERVVEVMKDLLARSPQNSAFTGMNLYFTIRDEDELPVEFLNESGDPLELITYRETRRQVPLRGNTPPRKSKPKLKVVRSA